MLRPEPTVSLNPETRQMPSPAVSASVHRTVRTGRVPDAPGRPDPPVVILAPRCGGERAWTT